MDLFNNLSRTLRELFVLSVTLPGLITTQLLLAIGQHFLKEILGLAPSPTEVRTAMAEILTSGLLKVTDSSKYGIRSRSEDDELYTFFDEAQEALRARVDPRSQLALQRAPLRLLNHQKESRVANTIYHQIRIGLTLLDGPDEKSLDQVHKLSRAMLKTLRS